MFYVILIFWLFGFFLLWKIPDLSLNAARQTAASSISIIIPARNEEHNLDRLLQSLSNQTHKAHEIIVIDDQSQDATADVAKKYGCRVIPTEDPPQGWLGKPWACWTGSKLASKEILLFLDSDVYFHSDALAKLVSAFEQKKGLLTVQPYHVIKENYERLSAIFNIIVMAGVRAFTPL